ncbi:MAG: hypothetical protein H0T71_11015 [Acidobacteria bacterium]|nr:hypothetical protein [Acidobacteriota bacterium]
MHKFLSRVACGICLLLTASSAHGGKVTFSSDGTFLVDGKPFFPIGIWVYNLDAHVMADLHGHHFNTIVGVGFKPDDVPLIEKHGMMMIPHITDEFFAKKDSPALLGWHLTDEPEEHKVSPAEVRKLYDALKAKEKDHPIGVTHNQFLSLEQFKETSDFTMTDIYPVTRDRLWKLSDVGKHTREVRRVNGAGWPNLTFVQTFGGPETDGGIWSQPLPHEVRFMAFNALVHRANGICYFSYWPRAPITWNAVAEVNRDIRRIVPWLIAEGEEVKAQADHPSVEIRARKVGDGWMVIATNKEPRACAAILTVPPLGDATLTLPFESRRVNIHAGRWREQFDPHEVRVYLNGDEPEWP